MQVCPGLIYFSHFQQAYQLTDNKLEGNMNHSEMKATWFGHVIRWKGSLANMLLQGCTNMVAEREKDMYKDVAE